jgi:hypothetical protein
LGLFRTTNVLSENERDGDILFGIVTSLPDSRKIKCEADHPIKFFVRHGPPTTSSATAFCSNSNLLGASARRSADVDGRLPIDRTTTSRHSAGARGSFISRSECFDHDAKFT